jgi:hypothetical protein
MLVVTVVPLLAAIIGLLVYVLASNPKVSEVGRIVFMTAILVVWFTMAGKTVRIG